MAARDSWLVGRPELDEFAQRSADLGVRVGAVAASDDGAVWIADVVGELGIDAGLIAAELGAAAPDLIARLGSAGLALDVPASAATARDALLGLSLAHLAVAETGSLLLAERTLEDRAVGMLPRSQVIVCPSDRLVASLTESAAALRAVASRPGAGMATLVTGPSRTADIERVLTVGVQGPGRVSVLFVDDLT